MRMNNLIRTIVLFTMLCVMSATATADVFYDTYQRGLAAFKTKEYANARADFLRAYELRPEPIILFNVAQTYRLELNSEQALVYYKRFLAESKVAEDLRNQAQAYVTELEAEQKTWEAQKKVDANAGPKEHDETPIKLTRFFDKWVMGSTLAKARVTDRCQGRSLIGHASTSTRSCPS